MNKIVISNVFFKIIANEQDSLQAENFLIGCWIIGLDYMHQNYLNMKLLNDTKGN